jgi:hypothetical protein
MSAISPTRLAKKDSVAGVQAIQPSAVSVRIGAVQSKPRSTGWPSCPEPCCARAAAG